MRLFWDIDWLLRIHVPYWRRRFAAVLLLALLEAAMQVLRPLPIKWLVEPEPGEDSIFAVFPRLFGIRWFWLCVLAILALAIGYLVLRVWFEWRLSGFVEQFARSLRRGIFLRLLRGPYATVSKLDAGTVIAAASRDTETMVGLIREGFLAGAVAGFQLALMLLIVFLTDQLLFVIIAVQIVLMGFGIAAYGQIRRKQYLQKMAVEGRIISLIASLHQRLIDVRFSPLRSVYAARAGAALRRFYDVHLRIWRVHGAYNALIEFTTAVGIALCLIVLIATQEGATPTIGKFIVFMFYAPMIFPALNAIGGAWPRVTDAQAALTRLGPATGFGMTDDREFVPVDSAQFGPIVFENVSLKTDTGRTILDNVSFTIEPGERFCIAGDSGTGKSTILGLIMGLIRPSAGRVTINGIEVGKLPLAARKRMFFLSRAQPAFIPGHVLENVAVNHNLDDQALTTVLQHARLDHRLPLATLRDGMTIGDRGEPFSGGEQQRVAASRWFHMDAPCLILDEALNSLDEAGELAITRALMEHLPDITMLVISHRRSATLLFPRRVELLGGGRWALIEPEEPQSKLAE
jgi:ABC-type multidrug transport system fused ATPase/permease subunit